MEDPNALKGPSLLVPGAAPSSGAPSSSALEDEGTELGCLTASNRLLDAVLELHPRALWVSDPEGTLVRINRACCELLGVQKAEVVGKYNCRTDPRVARQGLLPTLEGVFSQGQASTFTLTYESGPNRRALGHRGPIALEVTMCPVFDDERQLASVLVVHRDVKAERRLERQMAQAEKARAIARLANVAAHDLNNMLAVILGHAEMLWEELSADSPSGASLREIQKAAAQARTIAGQLIGLGSKAG